MDSAILEKVGLTKSESKVYLALLQLGNTTSGPVITKSKVSRSKVYEVLERLRQKNLVMESTIDGVKHFRAEDPALLLGFIDKCEQEIKHSREKIEQALPELQQLQKPTEETREAKLYVGHKGFKTFYDSILRGVSSRDEYLAFTFHDGHMDYEAIKHVYRTFHRKRAKAGIPARIIVHKNDKDLQKEMDYSQTKNWQIRQTTKYLPAGIAIIRDIVATVSWGKEPLVFVMVSKENADQYREYFDRIWRESKTLG